jgi:ferredoxin-NADP reductase
VDETPRCRSLVLEVPEWSGHLAGQHVDIRLTAEDGYQAQRSYSIASGPEDDQLVLTVERLDDGEVSPYLVDELRPEDELELRGPIGGYFVWERAFGGPLLLIAGGSGVVPFRSMLRHWSAGGHAISVRLIYSARSPDDLLYREELMQYADRDGAGLHLALTREWPEAWTGHRGRVDRALLETVGFPPAQTPLVYVCGPTSFVEAVAEALVQAGHEPGRIRTERFGPTGS